MSSITLSSDSSGITNGSSSSPATFKCKPSKRQTYKSAAMLMSSALHHHHHHHNHHHHHPPPTSVARRNERERNRVKMVNMGFATLRQHVPNGAKNKKMSKVETLRSAVEYIRELQKLLGQTPNENVFAGSASFDPYLEGPSCTNDAASAISDTENCSDSSSYNHNQHQMDVLNVAMSNDTTNGNFHHHHYQQMEQYDSPKIRSGSGYTTNNCTPSPSPSIASSAEQNSSPYDHHHHHQQQPYQTSVPGSNNQQVATSNHHSSHHHHHHSHHQSALNGDEELFDIFFNGF